MIVEIIADGTRITGSVDSFIAVSSPMRFDIMSGERFKGQLIFPCTVGQEYTYEELKAFCRLKRPSLANTEFELLPTGKPIFRN